MSSVVSLIGGGSMVGLLGLGCGAAEAALSSVYYRTLMAVQAQIQGLGLSGISPSGVVIKKLPLDRNLGMTGGLPLPVVLLVPEPETMNPSAGTNLLDDVIYAVRVTIFDRDNQEPTVAANLDRLLAWRERIARAFRNQPLAAVPEIYSTSVEPAEVVSAEAWARNLLTSALLLRFASREPRGTE